MDRAKTDPQEKREKSRQRGQDSGAREGLAREEAAPDRGVFRDDGQPRPGPESPTPPEREEDRVLHPDDPRHPNAPGTMNADKGAKSAGGPSPDDAGTDRGAG